MIKIIKGLKKKDFLIILLCIILVATQVWLELKIPDYMSTITSLIQKGGDSTGEILKEGLYMLSCAFGSLITAFVVGYFAALLSANVSLSLRSKVFNKVENFGMEEIKKFSISSLITRTTNDITQVEMTIAMGLQLLIRAPIMACWAITKILGKSMQWSLLTGAGVLVLLITIGTIMAIVMPRFSKVQKLIDKVNGVTSENLSGIRVIRAFNAEEYQEDRFENVNRELTKTQMFNQKCFAVMSPMMNMISHFLTLGIYFIGAFLISSAGLMDKISLFSDMIVFSSYGMQVIMSFLMLAMIFMILPRAEVSAKRINEVLDCDISIKDGTFSENTEEKGTVEFKNVSFKYYEKRKENVLENISFTAEPGEIVGIIGTTGSGKSSLVQLIPRLYDVTDGEVLVDGVNVKDYGLKNLRDGVGMVLQKNVLFSGSIEENLRWGDENATMEEIRAAADAAQADGFVNAFTDGYNMELGQGGVNVSGGQKQRLCIARALLKKPKILILDDSTSAVDTATEAKIRQAFTTSLKHSTKIIIAQRITSVIDADKIIVLEDGKIIGMGNHNELMKNCEEYRDIYYSQTDKEKEVS